MHYSANRVSGVFFLLFGLAMYFLVVPNYVKTVTGSNLAPKTLPNVISIVLALVGAVPGIGPIMAMAIAIPFTFALDPLVAISFLVGVNKGGLVGGAVPAVLMNTPGTPDAAATALDGYPLAKQGKPLKATKMALFSSITGDTFSDIVLITVSAPLAILALKMGPIEIVALMIFAFSVLAGLIGNSLVRPRAVAWHQRSAYRLGKEDPCRSEPVWGRLAVGLCTTL